MPTTRFPRLCKALHKRGNWLFTGSARGGRAAAILFSLIASAKRHGLDPFAYLRDLLARVPTHPHRRIDELFPDRWEPLDSSGQSPADRHAVGPLERPR